MVNCTFLKLRQILNSVILDTESVLDMDTFFYCSLPLQRNIICVPRPTLLNLNDAC